MNKRRKLQDQRNKGHVSWGDYAIRKILTFNIRYGKKLVERTKKKEWNKIKMYLIAIIASKINRH